MDMSLTDRDRHRDCVEFPWEIIQQGPVRLHVVYFLNHFIDRLSSHLFLHAGTAKALRKANLLKNIPSPKGNLS